VSQPLEDPRAELEALAHATRRAARRQQALGRRELPQPKPKPKAKQSVSEAPARSAEDVRAQAAAAPDLATLRACVSRCEACGLSKTRTQTVFMDGTAARKLLFVGEAPGADEDRQGVPFVGRAGQLLTDIIVKGMGIPRQEVAIANVLKCRPPDNREPTPAEKATCTPWLDRQVELLDPSVIVPLGRHAAMHVLRVEASMGAMRGQVHLKEGRQIVPTYHPAYLLRSPGEKKECWKDIQLAMGVLGMTVPARPGSGSLGEAR
jgi:DNA polymerase